MPGERPIELGVPADVRRIVDVMALEGEPGALPDELPRVAELGFETILVGVPDDGELDFVRRLGEQVTPRLRQASTGRH